MISCCNRENCGITSSMPEISRFLGIVIRMFYGDHNPPHFHAIYGDYDASFSIETLEMIEGRLPPRVKGLIIEWATLHLWLSNES